MFNKISSIFSVLFMKIQADPIWFQMGSKAVPTSSNWHGVVFCWYPRILYFYLIVYPFQMELHGVTQVYSWSHEMYPRICLAILDPEPFIGVSKCIQGYMDTWSCKVYPRICLAILDPEPFLGVAKCIQGSVWQFWIQNHSLELQSVSKDLFGSFGSRTIPWSCKLYPRICLAILDPEPFLGVANVSMDPLSNFESRTDPWSCKVYPRICLGILDPEPFLGVAKCIQGSV